jgi:hypothetical protein
MAVSTIPSEVKEYYNTGIRLVVKIDTSDNYMLLLTFSDGIIKRYDMSDKLKGVFRILEDKAKFAEAFIDECGNVAWDIDKKIDSSIHWNNRIDICADNLYIYGEEID